MVRKITDVLIAGMHNSDHPDLLANRASGPIRSIGRRKGKESRHSDAWSLNSKRARIAVWAIIIGIIFGSIEFGEPLEDAFRAIRWELRSHPADQSVLVVEIDDKTSNELTAEIPSREKDAILIETLFANGAKTVLFDRAYADLEEPTGDKKLLDVLKRHAGKVYFGTHPAIQQTTSLGEELVPNPYFRSAVGLASMEGALGPFGLSAKFTTSSLIEGRQVPTFSARLARIDVPAQDFRVDFATDIKTIPRISYVDVTEGRTPKASIEGKDVVVGAASQFTHDFHRLPFGGLAPGVYFHVIGAETIKGGVPVNLGWIPAFLLACGAAVFQAGRKRPVRRLTIATGVIMFGSALALDFAKVSIDIMPGLVVLGISALRLHNLARSSFDVTTGLPNLSVLSGANRRKDHDVYAIKLRNHASIASTLNAAELLNFTTSFISRLRASDPGAEYVHNKDIVAWSRPSIARGSLDGHIEGLHALFQTGIPIGDVRIDVTTSIGVDTNHSSSMRERLENAIQCAEDAGRTNNVFLVTSHDTVVDRAWHLQMLSELDDAIVSGQFYVAFQPKISLKTGSMVSAEALVRWDHPKRGAIDPATLVKAAELHNRIEKLTFFVLDKALEQVSRANELSPAFKVAVNLSSPLLQKHSIIHHIEKLLAKHRVPPGNLILEVTETAPLSDDPRASQTLAGLKKLGVELSVDDFGTGNATLEYLRRIPCEEVKIDRTFVINMLRSPSDRALVKTAIDTIHSLGLRAVAEGVENEKVSSMLEEMGCDQAQGYYYSRAVSMDVLLPQLWQRRRAIG